MSYVPSFHAAVATFQKQFDKAAKSTSLATPEVREEEGNQLFWEGSRFMRAMLLRLEGGKGTNSSWHYLIDPEIYKMWMAVSRAVFGGSECEDEE